MYDETIRMKLIKARERSGFTQKEVSEITKIPYYIIAKIESGHRKPDTETIGILAEFYNITTDYIFGIGKKEKEES